MFTHGANAESPHDFPCIAANANRNAHRAADTGLLGAGLGHAAIVFLNIADGHRTILCDSFASNAFADRNGFDDVNQLRRQADISNEMQQLRLLIEPVNGTGFGAELGEGVAEKLVERIIHDIPSAER